MPHCSGCFCDLEREVMPVKLGCGHLLCGECVTSGVGVCPIDGKSSEATEAFSIPEGEEERERLYAGVNTKGVLCKYVHRGIQCPDFVTCRYLHGLSSLGKDKKECGNCKLRFSSASRCPFCQNSLHSSNGRSPVDFPLSQAESLTSSLSDLMQSMPPIFPEPQSARQSLKEFNVLQSYVDLTLSDSSDQEEVVEVKPKTRPSLLELLRALWQFFRLSASAVVTRLTRRPDHAMVFYD